MTSHKPNVSLLRSLQESVGDIIEPLRRALLEAHQPNRHEALNAVDLLMGELTMVAMLFASVDVDVTGDELNLLNNVRRAVQGDAALLLDSGSYQELCRRFLSMYPGRILTIDHVPETIKHLVAYDRANGTQYAEHARALFLRFASAIVTADKTEYPTESISLANFKDILYSPIEVV